MTIPFFVNLSRRVPLFVGRYPQAGCYSIEDLMIFDAPKESVQKGAVSVIQGKATNYTACQITPSMV
jgi:hypothetical protein